MKVLHLRQQFEFLCLSPTGTKWEVDKMRKTSDPTNLRHGFRANLYAKCYKITFDVIRHCINKVDLTFRVCGVSVKIDGSEGNLIISLIIYHRKLRWCYSGDILLFFWVWIWLAAQADCCKIVEGAVNTVVMAIDVSIHSTGTSVLFCFSCLIWYSKCL